MLGLEGVDRRLPELEQRHVPGAYARFSKLRFRVDGRHPRAFAYVQRILMRYTCRSHWGLLECARYWYPADRDYLPLGDMVGVRAKDWQVMDNVMQQRGAKWDPCL